MDKVKEKSKGKICDEEVHNSNEWEGESSDKSVEGVHFENSDGR